MKTTTQLRMPKSITITKLSGKIPVMGPCGFIGSKTNPVIFECDITQSKYWNEFYIADAYYMESIDLCNIAIDLNGYLL